MALCLGSPPPSVPAFNDYTSVHIVIRPLYLHVGDEAIIRNQPELGSGMRRIARDHQSPFIAGGPRTRVPQRLFPWLSLVLLCLSPLPSYAENREKVLKLAVIDDVPSTRLAAQVLGAAYEKLGVRIETTVVPSRRALHMVNQGVVDGDLFRIKEVANQYPNLVQVPYPVLKGRVVPVVRAHHPDQLPQSSGPPLRVAVRRGVIIAEMTATKLGMEPVLARNYQQMRDLLNRGRVELMLVSDIEGLSPLKNNDWRDLKVLSEPVTPFELYHYLHQRHADLAKPLAKILREMDLNGEILRMKEEVQVGTLPSNAD